MGGSLLMYVYALLTTGRLRIPVQTIAVLFFVGMTYLFTYMFFSQNAKYIQLTILKTLVACFFTFLLVSKLSTFEYLCKYFTKGSFLITLSGVLYAEIISVIGHSTTSDWSTYSMTMSNVLLLSVLWQLNAYFDSKKQAGTYCCNYWFCGDIYIWIKKSVLSHWFLCFDKNIIQFEKEEFIWSRHQTVLCFFCFDCIIFLQRNTCFCWRNA